jgi:L-ascorbate metabolism protein UlaG (beta-lactamase superfamily)
MLPIGGHYTMGPKEAALAVRYLQPQVVLPVHFGTFPPLTGTPQQLAQLVHDSGIVTDPGIVALVAPGEELKDR